MDAQVNTDTTPQVQTISESATVNKEAIFGGLYEHFKAAVKQFMTHLIDAGIGKDALIHGYDYALSLIHDHSKVALTESDHKMASAELLKTAVKEMASIPTDGTTSTPG